MKTFLSWWCVVLGVIAALFYLFFTGQVQHIFVADITRVTWVTSALCAVATIVLGRACYSGKDQERTLEFGLFAEDACLRLGMLGTVLGCMIMFGSDIASAVGGDPAKSAILIGKISSSFGIAIGTTLVGIAASLVLKFQNMVLQNAIDA